MQLDNACLLEPVKFGTNPLLFLSHVGCQDCPVDPVGVSAVDLQNPRNCDLPNGEAPQSDQFDGLAHLILPQCINRVRTVQ